MLAGWSLIVYLSTCFACSQVRAPLLGHAHQTSALAETLVSHELCTGAHARAMHTTTVQLALYCTVKHDVRSQPCYYHIAVR